MEINYPVCFLEIDYPVSDTFHDFFHERGLIPYPSAKAKYRSEEDIQCLREEIQLLRKTISQLVQVLQKPPGPAEYTPKKKAESKWRLDTK